MKYEMITRINHNEQNLPIRHEADQISTIMAIAESMPARYDVTDLAVYEVIDGHAYPMMQYNQAR